MATKLYTSAQLDLMQAALAHELTINKTGIFVKMTGKSDKVAPQMVQGIPTGTVMGGIRHKMAISIVRECTKELRPDGTRYQRGILQGEIVEAVSGDHNRSRVVSVHIPKYWWDPAVQEFIPAAEWWPKFLAKKTAQDFELNIVEDCFA